MQMADTGTGKAIPDEERFAALVAEWALVFDAGKARRRAEVAAWTENFLDLESDYVRLVEAGEWVRGAADFFGVLRPGWWDRPRFF